MHCTHCHKEFTSIKTANRWSLFNSGTRGAHALWPRSSLTIPTHAARSLGSYASLNETCDLDLSILPN